MKDDRLFKTFKEGDIVKLKSGGPKMIVEKYRDDEVLKCTWFAGEELRRELFKENTLVLITQDDIDKEKGMAKAKVVMKEAVVKK